MALPFPTDPYERLHYNMVRAHHTFKVGHESILRNLEKSREGIASDLDNFLGYCGAWVAAIEHHHDSEEEVAFPFMSQKMDFGTEKEAHKVIHKGLNDLEAAIEEFRNDHAKYDPERIKAILVGMKDALFNHLDEEIEHIEPANMKKHGFTVEEMIELGGRVNKYVQTHGDSSIVVPFMRSHTPPEYKEIWPPMPWVVRKIVVPYAMAWKYSGYWKYSPYALS